jgi:hypothetical protein
MIFPTFGQILDVVDLKDRLATPAFVWRHAGAAGTLASTTRSE